LIVVDEPLKMNSAWGWLHINKNADPIFGASLNRAHWPAAAAIERRDWRAIRWLTSLAITERAISSGTHPHVVGAWRHLTTSVGIKPNCRWDALGVAYRLKDHPITERIKTLDLHAVGTMQRFASFEIRTKGKVGSLC